MVIIPMEMSLSQEPGYVKLNPEALMAEEKMFQEALDALNQGQRERARDLLTRLLRTNSSRADYWLWMSAVVDTPNEKIYCLESALKADPDNQAARRGLIILGARQADPNAKPSPLIRRKWEDELEKSLEAPKNFPQQLRQSIPVRWFLLLCLSAVVIGLVTWGIMSIGRSPEELFIRVTPFPTRTLRATSTPTVTKTSVVRSPTPTYIGPTPLWMFLTQTYTPVPLYINTPHPVIEAYRVALRAYARGDYLQMLNFIQQARQSDPSSVDFYYYLGEAHRLLGDFEQAVEIFEQGVDLDPGFGPNYLGLARTYLDQYPNADVIAYLDKAITTDPNMIDAYLLRAEVYIHNGNIDSARSDLLTIESIFPESALLYVLLAQIDLLNGDFTAGLVNAQKAYDLDLTLLPAYLTLAHAFLANENPTEAAYYAEIYARYAPLDIDGWLIIGQVHLQNKAYNQALEALDKAISLDEEAWEAYYYRGKAYLGLGKAQPAVNDLVVAVQRTPANFQYTFDLADALWKANRLTDSFRTFNSAEQLATDDNQRAALYYTRAQVAEQAGNVLAAKDDWALLLALPEDIVPEAWRAYAQEKWFSLYPPTATITATFTIVPSATHTLTPTPSSSPTRTAAWTTMPTEAP